MKKVLCFFVAAIMLFFVSTCYAGPNIFSSNNEQYAVLADYYFHASTQSLILANMAMMALDEETFEDATDMYEEYLTKAQEQMDNIYFTVPISSSNAERMEFMSRIRKAYLTP